jgi:hypothetical protein
MKRLGKIAVCLASGLVLNAGARADDVVLPNNPYVTIVVRNVFGLNPPQPVDPNAAQADLPKITPNGIMSIFGQLQVLFKVAGTAKSGQPAKDEFYTLSEGQRQDEIEVVQIDEKNSLVTFNNHGTVQELPLAKASEPVVNAPGGPAPIQNLTAPNGVNSGGIPGRFGGRPAGGGFGVARTRGAGNGGNQNPNSQATPMGGGSILQSTPTGGGYSVPTSTGSAGQTSQQSQNTLTAEEQAVLLETQRELWNEQGNPAAAILPPTMLTHQKGAAGTPPIP